MEEENKKEDKSVLEKLDEKIDKIINDYIDTNTVKTNITQIGQLIDIKKDIKKIGGKDMRYENYGTYNGYDVDNYTRENYGARGYDSKYRGHNYIDDMRSSYGRYMDSRERYGDMYEAKKSLKYMLDSVEDFIMMLKKDAKSQEEIEMIKETAQRIAKM